MGCCECTNLKSRNDLIDKVMGMLDMNQMQDLRKLKEQKRCKVISKILDMPITSRQTLKLNALGYTVITGRVQGYKILTEDIGCIPEEMHKLFESQHTSAIEILCERGYADFISYLLPQIPCKYLELMNTENKKNTYTPIQIATEKGYTDVIKSLHQFVTSNQCKADSINWDLPDENTGENCAMIACKLGNFEMVRLFFELCHANFTAKNKLGENALQIAAAGSRHKSNRPYAQVICYLIEIVGVDIRENCEETLLLIDDPELVKYFEMKLKKNGINISKKELEEQCKLEMVNSDEGRCEGFTHDFSLLSSISLASRSDRLFSNCQMPDFII